MTAYSYHDLGVRNAPGDSTQYIAFEGDSHVQWFDGNYSEYEQKRKQELGDDFMQPHRIKYKKIETVG